MSRCLSLHRITVSAISLLVLTGCGDIYRYAASGEVGWALKKKIRDRQRNTVTLNELTQLGYHGEFRVEERSFTPRDARFVVEPGTTLGNGKRQLILLWQATP